MTATPDAPSHGSNCEGNLHRLKFLAGKLDVFLDAAHDVLCCFDIVSDAVLVSVQVMTESAEAVELLK